MRSTVVAGALVAAALTMGGCGATVYDAVGVPKLVCATAALPLACGNTCLDVKHEDVNHCGGSCFDCAGADAASNDPAALAKCDNQTDPANVKAHQCDFDCPVGSGLVKNPSTSRCECQDPLAARCDGAAACTTQTVNSCGDHCVDCTNPAVFAVPAHAASNCDAPNRVCGFDCDAAKNWQKNAGLDACICNAGMVACGTTSAPRDTCVTESNTVCGPGCLDCTDPLQFKINTPVASAPRCALPGQGVSTDIQCTYTCPPDKPAKVLRGGVWDCDIPACDVTQHRCPADPTCYLNTDPLHCGDQTGCNVCGTPAGAPPGTTATCVANACDFSCPAGFFKSGGACVRVQTAEGGVAVGGAHTCAIITTDPVTGPTPLAVLGLMCWGANDQGQLGIGTQAEQHKAQPVTLAGGVLPASLAAGDKHTCAIADGGVQCWGANAGGQLGADPGAVPFATRPRAAIVGTSGAKAVVAGNAHTCALINAGTGTGDVVCWGANDKGQLGNTAAGGLSTAPVAVKTSLPGNPVLTGVAQISSAADHTCALVTTTTITPGVYCWGANTRGQAGQAASASVPLATRVVWTAGPKDNFGSVATRVAAGALHTCAATTDGRGAANTICWGDDTRQQLGDSNVAPNPVPPPVDARMLAKADLLAVGKNHSCNAVTGAFALVCAGANDRFQAGGAPAAPSLNKGDVTLPAGAGLTRLVSGGDHTCVVTTAGALLCFGANTNGQLGDGTTTSNQFAISPAPQ